jgi:hypothetical protein
VPLALLITWPFLGATAVVQEDAVTRANNGITAESGAIRGTRGENSGGRTVPEVQPAGSNTIQIGRVELDKQHRTICIPAKVRLRNEVVEYALVTEQGKGYESMFTTEARPMDIQVASLLLDLSPVEITGESGSAVGVPETNAVRISVTWETNGQTFRLPLASLIQLTSGRVDPAAPPMQVEKWLYNGSQLRTNGFAAQLEGSIISLIRDPTALINNPGLDRDNDEIHFPNRMRLPPEGTPVRVILHMIERNPISPSGVGTR